MQAYLELREEKDPDRVSVIRSDLWEYSNLDTLGMVKILERLESLCRWAAL